MVALSAVVSRYPTSATSSATSTLSTTEIYARAPTEAKRKALEAAYPDVVTDDPPEWNQDPGLLDWLTNL
jgi:hypothetical protein